MTDPAPWHQDIALRRHPQAKRLTLRADPVRRQITCTVPEAVSSRVVERFLIQNRPWIERQKAAFPAPFVLRDGAELPFRGESLTLRLTQAQGRTVRREGSQLVVPGGPLRPADRLRRWLATEALALFNRQARPLVAKAGVPEPVLSVRDPRTRWGSCSAKNRISLSWRLVLAPDLVSGYVVAHEVAHLRHRNHGPAFWDLTRTLWPETDAAEAWLKANGAGLHRILAADQ